MTLTTIHAAKTHLSRLIQQACNGEAIVIARGKTPLVRLTSRIINRLPHKGSISTAESEALWQQALAPEKELTGEPLAWNRRYVDYCRENALLPGSFQCAIAPAMPTTGSSRT